MQIEKYVHITKTPTGALVSFAGQVCLTISHYEGSDSYFWRASPMFLKLTTGANAFEMPQSYTSHSSMAEAVAAGLTKLDELGAFYGVIDLPEDTHGQVSEEYEDDVEAMLAESFVVRKTEKARGVKSRIMISAAAVLGRAAELAKEAGEKSGPKWVKMAHKEYSTIKAEEVESIDELSKSTLGSYAKKAATDAAYKELNAGQMGINRADDFGYAADKKAKKRLQGVHVAVNKLTKEEFIQYEDAIVDGLASIKEDCRAEALSMCDSLLEAQQLAAELFEDISEEYLLNELSKATLGSYAKKSNAARTYEPNDHIADNRGTGVMRALDKLAGKKAGPLKGKAITAHWSAASSGVTADKANKDRASFEKAVDKLTKEEVDEAARFAMDDIAVGGTVIYKTLKGDHKMSKVRNKGNGFALHLQDGSTIQNHAVRSTDASDWNQFKDLKEEVLDETVNADHYNATSEPSQFGGFRPKVVHKRKGTTMYLGQYAYKTKAAAAEGAKAYLDAYGKIGDMAASRAVAAHALKHPDYIKEELDEEVLDEKLDRHGDFHKSVENGIFAHSKYLDTTKKYLHDKDTRSGDGLSMKLATFDHEKHAQAAAKKHGGRVERTDFGTYRVTEEVLDEATRPLSGDAYWKSKEVESKEEYLKAQRKALGLPEPVKRGRGKPTNIDRDLLKTRAHSNVEAGKRPTAGFDRNEKIHFVRHLKDHPDFAEKHVSKAGRPTGTTKVASQQQALVKKKQDTAFSMWAGLGKK